MLVLNRDAVQIIMYYSSLQDVRNMSCARRMTYYAMDSNFSYNWFCLYFKKQLPEIAKRYSVRIFKNLPDGDLEKVNKLGYTDIKYIDLLRVLVKDYHINELFRVLCYYGELDELIFIMRCYPECDPKAWNTEPITLAA